MNTDILGVPNLVPWSLFNVNVFSIRAWIVSFAGSDSTLALSPQLTGVPRWVSLAGNLKKIGVMGGGRNYSSEAIILNISVKGGDHSRELINRGMAIIEGNTVYTHSSYTHWAV